MGYFSRLDHSIQTDEAPPNPVSRAPEAKPAPAPPVAKETAPAAAPAPSPAPESAAVPVETPAAAPVPAPEMTPTPAPAVKLDAPSPADDSAARKAHEEAEAKRKAEWEARQAAKKAARQKQLDRIKAMNDADLLAASVSRVSTDTERLTRRNMKEAVAGHIQDKCREDAAFARLVMDPDKTMVNCFKYINRKAQAYAEQEMKDHGIDRVDVYALDVPDGQCFQWAEDYFSDPNAQEDKEKEEVFTPKPYIPKSSSAKPAAKPKSKAKAAKKTPEQNKPTQEKPKGPVLEQMSLL